MVLGDSQPALYQTIKVMRKTKSAKLSQARGDWGKVMTKCSMGSGTERGHLWVKWGHPIKSGVQHQTAPPSVNFSALTNARSSRKTLTFRETGPRRHGEL